MQGAILVYSAEYFMFQIWPLIFKRNWNIILTQSRKKVSLYLDSPYFSGRIIKSIKYLVP